MAPRQTTKGKAAAPKGKAPTKSASTKKAHKVEKAVAAPVRRSTRTTKATSAQIDAVSISEEAGEIEDPRPQSKRAMRKAKSQAKLPTPPQDNDLPKSVQSDKKLIAIASPLLSPAEVVAPIKRATNLSARPKKAPSVHHPKGIRVADDVADEDQDSLSVNPEAPAVRGVDPVLPTPNIDVAPALPPPNDDVASAPPLSNDDVNNDDLSDITMSDYDLSSNDAESEGEPMEVVDPTYFDTTGCIPGVDIAGPDDIHFSKHVNIPGKVSAPSSYTGKVPWKSVWKPETLKARGGNKDDFTQFLTACGLEKGYYDGLDATGLACLCSARQTMNLEAVKKEENEKKEKEKAEKAAARELAKKTAKPKIQKPKAEKSKIEKTKVEKTKVEKHKEKFKATKSKTETSKTDQPNTKKPKTVDSKAGKSKTDDPIAEKADIKESTTGEFKATKADIEKSKTKKSNAEKSKPNTAKLNTEKTKTNKSKSEKPKTTGELLAGLMAPKSLPKKITGASKNTTTKAGTEGVKNSTKEAPKVNKAAKPTASTGFQIIEENPAATMAKPKRKRSRDDDGDDDDGENQPAKPTKKVKVAAAKAKINKA